MSSISNYNYKKISILYMLANLPIGGVGSYILNICNNIDKNIFDITVAVCDKSNPNNRFQIELAKIGVKLLFLPPVSIKSLIKTRKQFDSFFKQNNQFDIVELHVPNMAFFVYKSVRKYTKSKFLIHFHNSKLSTNFFKGLRNYILERMSLRHADYYISCGELVSEKMKRLFRLDDDKTFVFTNGMVVKREQFDSASLDILRKELNVQNKRICLAVGNCVKQKNYKFLIKVFDAVEKHDKSIHLLVAGGGFLLQSLRTEVVSRGLTNVSFLGPREDVYKLMSISNMFIMPSLNEGLPLAGIECQTYGLPTIFSSKITREIGINDNVTFVNLKSGINEWEQAIEKCISLEKEDLTKIVNSKFNISKSIKVIESTYKDILVG